MHLSFRYRFILSFLSIELFFITLIVFFNFASLSKLSHSLIEEKIQTGTALFVEMAKTPLLVYDLGTLDNQTDSFVKLKNIAAVKVLDKEHRLLSNASTDEKNNVERFDTLSGDIVDGGRTFRLVTAPIKIDNEEIGEAKILFEITESLNIIDKNRRWTFFLILIEIIISTIVAYLIGHRLTVALNELILYAARIAQDEQMVRSGVQKKGDEISVLSETLYLMQERIAERDATLNEAVIKLKEDIIQRNELEYKLIFEKSINNSTFAHKT